ncbi:MAG TPA: PAS domain S-box protein [Methanobacteriaceae archaeon]|nr:PAS domain S-box protein [Methanobacteriaceae archaeon]
MEWGSIRTKYETFLVLTLIAMACVLTYYFHFVLGTGIIFTHFYYIPIILSAIWWKRKGLWVPFFLAGILIFSDWINPLRADPLTEDFFRAIIFISVSIITVILSERIEKSRLRLKISETRFRSVVESALDGIITTDISGDVVFVNESFQKMFKYSEDEVVGQSVRKFMPIRYRENYDKQLKHFQITGEHKLVGKTFESMGMKKDGKEFPFEMSITIWEVNDEKFTTSIIRDITDRKNAEKTKAILSAIVENSEQSIIGKDLKGNILSWNRGAENIYGYKAGEVLGKSISLLFLPGSDELSQILDTISRGETIDHYETKRRTKNGNIIDISLVISPIKDVNGKIIGASTIARDITREKMDEEALAKSEAQLSLITANMADIICQASTDGSYIYVSPSVKSVLGYEPLEMIGKSMYDFIHPADVDNVVSCMQEAIGECMTQLAQYRYRKADDSYIWLETMGTPLFNMSGEVSGFVCNSRDITQQKETEKALKDSEEKYRFLIESAKDPIFIVDQNGKFLLVNTAGADKMQLKAEDFVGKTLWDIFLESADLQMGLIKEVISSKNGVDVELPITYDGVKLWFSTSIQPLISEDGSVESVQIIARDISQIKKVQKQLENALEDKDMLMKEIYHRVKNNLMVISSLLNLQSHYIKDKEAQGMFKESQNRARSMALIHERLYRSTDLKRIDFGDYIRTMSKDLLHTYASGSGRINLEIDVEEVLLDINTSIPLGLIVNELISNSLKHAFPGGRDGNIKVKFHQNKDEYLLEVADNGVGLPEDMDLQKTGSLGMQLVYSLTEQINGHLKLERSPGATFRITFKEEKYSK